MLSLSVLAAKLKTKNLQNRKKKIVFFQKFNEKDEQGS